LSSDCVRILVARHSVFYTPLLVTIAGGFLEDEGLEASYSVKPPNRSTFDLLAAGEVDIIQSAVSSNWSRMESGISDLPLHFAQINRRDGFWITGRTPEPFKWNTLEGSTLLADHGPQPLAMLRYAASLEKVVWNRVRVLDMGTSDDIEAAFRAGQGDFCHLQGPAAQGLEADGLGYVVGSVGQCLPMLSFSSLTARREYLMTSAAGAFMKGYREAISWLMTASAGEVASVLLPHFEKISIELLTASIKAYQDLGCWTDDPSIPEEQYDQSLEVFMAAGAISNKYLYRDVVVAPP